jgi:hypothetical protein
MYAEQRSDDNYVEVTEGCTWQPESVVVRRWRDRHVVGAVEITLARQIHTPASSTHEVTLLLKGGDGQLPALSAPIGDPDRGATVDYQRRTNSF